VERREAGLRQRKVDRADFATHPIGLDLECYFLSLGEYGKTGALDCADVHKDIIAAIARLDKAKALLTIEPLYSTSRHFLLQSAHARSSRGYRANQFNVDDVFGKGARGRIQQGTAANRMHAMYAVSTD